MMLIKASCGSVRGQRGETIPNGVGLAKIRELQKFQLLPTPWVRVSTYSHFLYTGGVFCALYKSLLISKLPRFSRPIPSNGLVMGLPQMGERYEVNTLGTARGGVVKWYVVNTLRIAPRS
jgi:hypothetical protein